MSLLVLDSLCATYFLAALRLPAVLGAGPNGGADANEEAEKGCGGGGAATSSSGGAASMRSGSSSFFFVTLMEEVAEEEEARMGTFRAEDAEEEARFFLALATASLAFLRKTAASDTVDTVRFRLREPRRAESLKRTGSLSL